MKIFSHRVPNSITSGMSSVSQRGKTGLKRVNTFIQNNKRKVLGVILAILLVSFGAAQFTKEAVVPEAAPIQKPLLVETIIVGHTGADIETVGTVKNLGAVTLVAQTAGPVKKINVQEGDTLKKSSQILQQETGYGTGNAAWIGVEIAQKNLDLAQKSLGNTQESVNKSRQVADENRNNTEELRKISAQSIDGTRKIVDTTKQVIAKIETDIAATTDSDIIQGLRQQLVSYQNILVNTESSLRNVEYSTNTDKSPEKLANFAKDQVYISTQIQLESAQISRDIAELSLRSSRINASLSTVRAPYAAKVERILVTEGQYLSPGTPVARITSLTPELSITAQVSGYTASRIQEEGLMKIVANGQEISLPIAHVSSTPTAGQLYEVLAFVPETYADSLFEGQAVSVTLPTALRQTMTIDGSSTHQIPLDAVFVTGTERYVYLHKEGKAVKQIVETGDIIGNSIEVISGLQAGDELIVDRRVVDGQPVEATPRKEFIEERG